VGVAVSVVIPVFNEASMVRSSLQDLARALDATAWEYEIVVAENGSFDGTVAEVQTLRDELPRIRLVEHPQPNYGAALKAGILAARGEYVVCEEIDLCDVEFHKRALEHLRADEADMVIGSKAMRGAHDTRPWHRRFATRLYNRLLRVLLGFRGTDTHGLKAFRRSKLVDVLGRCVTEFDVLASEFVIRAQREGVRVLEIPVEVRERRAPSIRLWRRVPKVLKNLGVLTVSIYFGRSNAKT
jgi:glycosyltransferase involved in cell wall biosynthesis